MNSDTDHFATDKPSQVLSLVLSLSRGMIADLKS